VRSAAPVLRALLPFALHGLAREVDAAAGILLHTTLDLPGIVGHVLALVDVERVLGVMAAWTAVGAAVWLVCAAARARLEREDARRALESEAAGFAPLYLRPILTSLALLSLAVRPTYPYGFTLPVALTQDWGIAQDAAALAALVAWRAPALRSLIARIPAPRAGGLAFLAFLAYALVSPPWAREWDGHPGNEPKYLRMAVAIGHDLTLDVERVSDAMERLAPEPFLAAATRAAGSLLRESAAILRALWGGEPLGASAIRATRITRQTIRGKDGGTFHVLAPGPSFLLAPALRADRTINLERGTPGRLAVTLLLWNALAAALVAAVYLLARDASGRPGLAAALAAGFALTPPFLFYSYQFYPEMLGALVLALVLRQLLYARRWDGPRLAVLGLLLASLPWLHQKFLPVWGVLSTMAVIRAVDRLATFRGLAVLVLPQAATLYLTALYNFAITGSVRPDALFLAWGPAGVTTARLGQGLLGLLLDARYGILPYAPVYLLAAGTLFLGGPPASRLRWALPPAAVYYLTVASADNWAGAVSNLGRYVLPLAPLLVAMVAVVLDRAGGRRGVLTVALAFAAWTALLGAALWRDPHAANDCALLLGRSTFADGNAYLPNLFVRAWADGAPGLFVRLAVWLAALSGLALWLRRAARGPGGDGSGRALAGLAATVLAGGLLLESWPTSRTAPRFPDVLEVRPGTLAFFSGAARVEGDVVRAGPGDVSILIRSRALLEALELRIEGTGRVRAEGQPAIPLMAPETHLRVPVRLVRELTGRRGVTERLYRQTILLEAAGPLVLRLPGGVP
jgi:hypothetical protein